MSATLSPADFAAYQPGPDPYADEVPQLRLGDLPRAWQGEPGLSYMISTWNRRAQLARSLECLARQEWREFEVLLCDDGSTQDIRALVARFEPYLNLRYFRLERPAWHSCPSRAYHHMLPEVRGEVVAIAHPEMMLHPAATGYLYRGCMERLPDAHEYGIGRPGPAPWRWVSLKPYFLDGALYRQLDTVDWHADWNAITTLPGFLECSGFGGHPNSYHLSRMEYPWWFVGAARRDCPVWTELPITDGHAIIDMWLMNWRRVRGALDVTPYVALCLHQPHQTTAIGVAGEQDSDRLKMRHNA